jgi:hypothetical protein
MSILLNQICMEKLPGFCCVLSVLSSYALSNSFKLAPLLYRSQLIHCVGTFRCLAVQNRKISVQAMLHIFESEFVSCTAV